MSQLDLFSMFQPAAESIDTEFKSARGGMPGSFWESYAVKAPPNLAEDPPHKDEGSPHKSIDSPHNDHLLWSIGEPARAKERLAPETMKALILEMCTERWLSAKEIAEVLNRDPQKIQARFLTKMVRDSLLELRHPGVPNRPDQAYKTLKK